MRILVLNRREREAHHTRGSYSMHRRPLNGLSPAKDGPEGRTEAPGWLRLQSDCPFRLRQKTWIDRVVLSGAGIAGSALPRSLSLCAWAAASKGRVPGLSPRRVPAPQ